jgi:type I restriction enzyme M protein
LALDNYIDPRNKFIQSGYIEDFISKLFVKSTPEEVEAVQVFAKRLVNDFGYPSKVIQTHPQQRIRQSPSGKEKYPVDICVYKSDTKHYDNIYIIVECKRKSRKDGEKQLQLYMNLCAAQIGVWFNGSEHLYIKKIIQSDGSIRWQEIPTIPKYGQKLSEIGKIKRNDLKPPTNLKVIFKDIRNHLAGNTTGITRDESLAREIINLLFCKIYDEKNVDPEDYVTFVADNEDKPKDVQKRIQQIFEKVKKEYDDVFDYGDSITLDPESVTYVVGELQNYAITEANREAVGEAFEIFIGPALRGSEGQFFTPRNVVKMMVDVLDPNPKEMIIDPACGSGGFLIVALEIIWKKIETDGKARRWPDEKIWNLKRDSASRYFRGLDKDAFLTKVTKSYMAIVGDGRGGIFCENALLNPKSWENKTQDRIDLEKFDIVVTNPPFGTKIPIKGSSTIEQYDLGHAWIKKINDDGWEIKNTLLESQSPQILFIERCLQFLKDGGRMGIILPESIFGMPKYSYVIKWLQSHSEIVGMVSMPEELFQPNTHAKTCVVFIKKRKPRGDYPIHMAVAYWCGHDSRGNETVRIMTDGKKVLMDDIPNIAEKFKDMRIWS